MTYNLDAKDIKILEQLELDCRQSDSSVAKKVGLSKQVVNYRIKSLVSNNVISSFLTIIDVQKISYCFYHVFLKTEKVSQDKENEIIDFIKNMPQVGWLVTCIGKWNIAIAFLVKDPVEFNECIEKIYEKFKDYIGEKRFLIVIEGMPCKKKYLFPKKLNDVPFYFGKRESIILNKSEILILQQLSKDPLMSLVDVANNSSLSYETVKAYIKKMQDEKLIQAFTIKINPFSYGYEWYAVLIELDKFTKDDKKRLINLINAQPNSVFISNMIGMYNMVVDLHVKNILELNKIMREIQEKSGIIKTYEPLLILKEYKCNFIPNL